MTALHVTPHEPIGATLTGLSLRNVDAAVVTGMRALLAEHGVLVLPDQHIDDAPFDRMLRAFGEPMFTKGETPVDGWPDLNLISNVGRTTPPRSSFHVDTSYVREPPSYTALRAVTVPEQGGATLFTNQYRAYETLPVDVRDRLAGRRVTHVVTGVELDPGDEFSARTPIPTGRGPSGRCRTVCG